MSKKYRVLFAAICISYFLALLSIFSFQLISLVRLDGITIQVPIEGYDPVNPFFGRFMRVRSSFDLRAEEENRPGARPLDFILPQRPGRLLSRELRRQLRGSRQKVEQVYLVFNANGKLSQIQEERPSSGYFIAGASISRTISKYTVSLPVSRYYLPARQADKIEAHWRELQNQYNWPARTRLQILVGKNGRYIVEGILVGGFPLEEWTP